MRGRPLVVVPTFNEAENLVGFVDGVRSALPDGDLLIVDDDSPDGTGDVADALAAASGRVSVLHRPRKSGLASAYVDGFQLGIEDGYDLLFQMDADGSHDPAALPQLRMAIEGGAEADLALGSRYVAGGGTDNWPWHRELISRGGSMYARALLRLPVRDTTSGFKCWRADLLRTVLEQPVSANGYVFQIEMTFRAIRAGARVVEVPILFSDREFGESKFDATIVGEALRRVAFMGGRDLVRLMNPTRERAA